MTKRILLTSTIVVSIFSGCLGLTDAKPTIKKVEKVKDKSKKVTKEVKKATNSVENITKESKKEELNTPPESLLKDKVIETVVEISDDKDSTTKPQIIESVD